MEKFWSRNFSLLVCGQLFSVFANSVLQFTLSLYILDLTGSAAAFAGIMTLSVIPRVICLPFGGILADRLNKKKVMIVLDFTYALLTVTLGLTLFYRESIFFIGLIVILLGIVSSFETPVVQSCIPIIRPQQHLEQSNGIINAIAMLSNLLGPILAGILYAILDASHIFIGCCFIFIIAVIFESFLIIVHKKDNTGNSIKEIIICNLKELKRYLIKEQPIIIKITLIAAMLNMLLSCFIVVGVPYIVRIELLIGSELFGTMQMFFAIGGLMGSLIVGIVSKKIAPSKLHYLLIIGSILFSLLIVPFIIPMSKLSMFWIITIIITTVQIVFATFSVYMITVIQKITSPNMIGRVMSLLIMLSTFALPIGQSLYGLLLEKYFNKIIFIILIVSVICVIVTIISGMVFNELKSNFKILLENKGDL